MFLLHHLEGAPASLLFISQDKAMLCSCNRKPEILYGLRQQDLFLTQTLVGGLCPSLISGLPGSWLPCLEGFGPTSEYSGLEGSHLLTVEWSEMATWPHSTPVSLHSTTLPGAWKVHSQEYLVDNINHHCVYFVGLHACVQRHLMISD